MPKQFGSSSAFAGFARLVVTVAGFFIACASSTAMAFASEKFATTDTEPKPADLAWQQVFSTAHAPRYLEFSAHFSDMKGQEHTLHYWRDGGKRLRRNTDGNVDLMVERLVDGAYRYHVLDHRKKIITHIDQTNLQRIGQFSSWDDLSRALIAPPSGTRLKKLDTADFSVGKYRCKWYGVISATPAADLNGHQSICWSQALSIPLKITSTVGEEEKVVWKVETISLNKLSNAAFTSNVAGYAEVNANEDISPESD